MWGYGGKESHNDLTSLKASCIIVSLSILFRTLSIILLTMLIGPSGFTQNTKKSKKLNAMIEKEMKEWQIPGLSAVVVKNGEVVFTLWAIWLLKR